MSMKTKSQVRFAAAVIILALIVLLLAWFWIVTLNIVGGILLFLMMDSVLEWLERHRVSGWHAYIVLGMLCAAGTVAFILYVTVPLVDQAGNFARDVPILVEQLNTKLANLREFAPIVDPLTLKAKEWFQEMGASSVSHITTVMTSIVTMLLMAAILLGSRKTLRDSLTEQIPNNYFEVTMSIAFKIIDHVRSYVAVKALETVILIFVHALGFALVGVPSALLLGIIAGVLNLIPYLGAVFAAIPVGLVAYFSGGSSLFWFSMIVLLVARVLDDTVLQTWLVSRFVDVHPLTVVIAILVAGEVLGVLGMIIAIPAYVISKIILQGMYEYFSSVGRHELLLQQEENE